MAFADGLRRKDVVFAHSMFDSCGFTSKPHIDVSGCEDIFKTLFVNMDFRNCGSVAQRVERGPQAEKHAASPVDSGNTPLLW